MNYKNILYYSGIVLLVLVIILIILIVLSGKNNNPSTYLQEMMKPSMTKTYIGPVKNYQLIPEKMNSNGGWDSISGWYEKANQEQYWEETWMNNV